MVADLVRDHVRPREVALRAEALCHVAVEAQVEIHVLVGGTVERADGRGRITAAGRYAVPIQHELGALVGTAGILERALPRPLGVGEDVGAEVLEVALGILGGRDLVRAGVSGRVHSVAELVVDVEGRARAASAEHLDREVDQQPDQADSSADSYSTGTRAAARARAAPVDHVGRLFEPPPPHERGSLDPAAKGEARRSLPSLLK